MAGFFVYINIHQAEQKYQFSQLNNQSIVFYYALQHKYSFLSHFYLFITKNNNTFALIKHLLKPQKPYIMKKFLFYLVSMLLLASCSNQEDLVSQEPNLKGKANFKTFAIYGEVHNKMLEEAATSFTESNTDIQSKDDAINHVLNFQKKCVSNLALPDKDKQILAEGLGYYKNYYVTKDLMKTVRSASSEPTVNDETEEDITTEEIISMINEAHNTGAIDDFEYESFMKLVDCVIANASGALSNHKFQEEVNKLISQWEIKYADVDFSQLEIQYEDTLIMLDPPGEVVFVPNGSLSGVVLNVSQSSLEYWQTPETRALPAFVGADIVGAVIGACNGAANSYFNSKKINWKSVAWSSASGAIVGSTGIVGKVGRWLSKFL